MGSTQTRRSISVKGLTYQRLKKYVDEHGGSVSGFVEDLIREKLGEPDDEDRRKFGEAMAARQKDSEAQKADKNKESENEFDESYIPPITVF
jgi:hypothetical protein